jgi:hypothetical protein
MGQEFKGSQVQDAIFQVEKPIVGVKFVGRRKAHRGSEVNQGSDALSAFGRYRPFG